MTNDMTEYNSVLIDIKNIIDEGRNSAYCAVNSAMIMTYWSIGRRIVEDEQNGEKRAEYGKELLELLAIELTKEYGKGFTARNLRNFRQFYLMFPKSEIWNTCVPNLNWSHFRSLLRVSDEDARIWYMNEAAKTGWSSRTLDRNIGTQYYYRLLQSPKKEPVIQEMMEKTVSLQNPAEISKSPVIAEFLGFRSEDSYIESELESSIITHIRDFLMEMGRGFAFVARQQHIVTDSQDYYIDLVFYELPDKWATCTLKI